MLLGFPFREEGVSRVILVVLDTWPGILPSASRDLLLAIVSCSVFFFLVEETVCVLAQLMSLPGGVIESQRPRGSLY